MSYLLPPTHIFINKKLSTLWYYKMLSEVFWSFFLTTVTACLLGVIKILYKSKCKRCNICGLKIERDVEGEEQIDNHELDINARNNII